MRALANTDVLRYASLGTCTPVASCAASYAAPRFRPMLSRCVKRAANARAPPMRDTRDACLATLVLATLAWRRSLARCLTLVLQLADDVLPRVFRYEYITLDDWYAERGPDGKLQATNKTFPLGIRGERRKQKDTRW